MGDDWALAEPAPQYYLRQSHNASPTPSPIATNYSYLNQNIERVRSRLLGWGQATVANRKPAVLRFAGKVVNIGWRPPSR